MYAYMRPRAPLANSPIALPGGRPESLQTIADVYFDVENNNNYYYYYYYDYYYYYYYTCYFAVARARDLPRQFSDLLPRVKDKRACEILRILSSTLKDKRACKISRI